MIIISGLVTIEPEDHDAALDVLRPMAEASNAEEGCHAYGFWFDPDDPGRFRVFEEWESAEALEQHFASDHMAAFGAGIVNVRVTGTELHRYEVSDKQPMNV